MAQKSPIRQEQTGANTMTHLMVIAGCIIVFCMMFTDQLDLYLYTESTTYYGIGSFQDVLFGEYANALISFFGYLIFGVLAVLAFIPFTRAINGKTSLSLHIVMLILAVIGFIFICILQPVFMSSFISSTCSVNGVVDAICENSVRSFSSLSLKGGPISAIVFGVLTGALIAFTIYSDVREINIKKLEANSKNKNIKNHSN